MHVPYTYLVTFVHPKTQQKLYYYGCRFARKCHPGDLFVSYFTSSKDVKRLIAEHSVACFLWEVRRTFEDKDSVLAWETKVLRRIGAVKDERFLNKFEGSRKFSPVLPMTEEHRAAIKAYASTRPASHNASISKAHKGKILSEDHKAAIGRGITGEKNPFHGKKHSERSLSEMSEKKQGGRNPMYGRKQSAKHAATISKRVVSPEGRIFASKKEVIESGILNSYRLSKALREGSWKVL